MKKLSKRDRRVLMLGGVGITIFVVISYVVLPFYAALAEIAEDLQSRALHLQRSEEVVQAEETYRSGLKELGSQLAQYENQLLDAQDPSTAISQLEIMVRDLAGQNNLKVTRTTPKNRKIGERYIKISLQVGLEGDIMALTHFLHSVATYSKFLLVEDFYLSSYQVRKKYRLQPRMDISAFIQLS